MKKYKNFDFKIKAIDKDDSKELGFVSGLASTFDNVDRDGDLIIQGAFSKSLKTLKENGTMVPLLYSHKFDSVIGGVRASNLNETKSGLQMDNAEIDINIQDGAECYSLAKKGFLNSLSIGYSVPRGAYEITKEGNMLLKEVTLYEVSLVPVPANPQAVVTDVKAVSPLKSFPVAQDDTAWDSGNAVKNIKSATGSTDSPSASYKNAFMWYDKDNADNFGAYKLPFVDEIGGELKIVPRALFAIAAVLGGGRGGVDIPSSDVGAVKSKVEAAYKKIGRDSPFEDKSIDIRSENRALLENIHDHCMIMTLFNDELTRGKL